MNEIKSNNTANDNKIEKQTILAVDDEESIIDLLKFNIEKEGYNFISANNFKNGNGKITRSYNIRCNVTKNGRIFCL